MKDSAKAFVTVFANI